MRTRSLLVCAVILLGVTGWPFPIPQAATWSDVAAPGSTVALTPLARVTGGGIQALNRVVADAGPLGYYRISASSAVTPALTVYLPYVSACPNPIADDMSNPASGWPVLESAAWSYGYSGGQYRLYAKQGDVAAGVSRGHQGRHPTLAIDARQLSAVNGSMGLLLYVSNDWSELYSFEIYPATQEYAVFHYSGGYWYELARGISSAIHSGSAWNRLQAAYLGQGSCAGGTGSFGFYANGTQLVTLCLPDVIARWVGLIAVGDAAGFEARFDNYLFQPDCDLGAAVAPAGAGNEEASFEAAREGGLPKH